MTDPADTVPVVLLAYARPAHLARVLGCLRENKVPLIHAFADGAKGSADSIRVREVRELLQAIDWCEVRLTERPANLGLGRNVLSGVSEVAACYEAFIVWEDDLICVPGTYAWLCAALRHYADDPRVTSVSAWTHPRVTPAAVGDQPYFDGRADCWVWGGYSRSWRGMDQPAAAKMAAVEANGLGAASYGADLPRMARDEACKNIWAVRWLYHHLQHGGLCLRPPWSMVEHIGFDPGATNACAALGWENSPLRPVPPQPDEWPQAVENLFCRDLWRVAYPRVSLAVRVRRKLLRVASRVLKPVIPAPLRTRLRCYFGWRWFRGDFRDWTQARAASGGYDDKAIVQKVLAATLEVKAGWAAFERDGVLFYVEEADRPLLEVLQEIVRTTHGRLRVLDFGGSLGSNYWRHRSFLPDGDNLRWDVVEQGAFVEAGRGHLADTPLKFHVDAQAAQATGAHDVLLCSCVLQYLEEPFRALEEWSRLEIPFVLLNNLPLHATGPDRLKVQHVPPSIYAATYPVWFFNRETFLQRASVHYEIIKEFATEAVWPLGWGMFQSTGLLLKRRARP